MNNAEKFKEIFKKFATEVWAFPEKDFLIWLNAEYKEPTTKNDCEHCAKTYGTLGCCDYVNNEPIYSCKEGHEEYARGLRKFGSTTKNDLGVIDRAELLKAMNTWDKFGYLAHVGLIRLGKEQKYYVQYVRYEDMVNCVKGLPSVIPYMSSVTPQPCDDAISRKAVLDVIEREQFKGDAISEIEKLPLVTPQEPTIKALGEELRKARKGIADEKVLIGFNMAVAICNKHLGESEDKK